MVRCQHRHSAQKWFSVKIFGGFGGSECTECNSGIKKIAHLS